MGVGQLSESDAVDALRLPFSSSRHARGSNRRAITLIWGIPVKENQPTLRRDLEVAFSPARN